MRFYGGLLLDFDHFIQIIFSGIIGILGFFIKMIHAKAEKNQTDIASFKTYVALTHPTKETIDRILEKIDARFDKTDEKLEKILEKSKNK